MGPAFPIITHHVRYKSHRRYISIPNKRHCYLDMADYYERRSLEPHATPSDRKTVVALFRLPRARFEF